MSQTGHNSGGIAAERLRSFVERIERLEAEKAALQQDLREVYKEAEGTGFDSRTLREIVKLRKLDEATRQEREALLDVYKAALGMLADTPLGAAAIRKIAGARPAEPKPQPAPPADDKIGLSAPPPAAPTPEEIAAARKAGRTAGAAGAPITGNPHPAGDPRRAAWDEGWCQGSGSDGMDIPAFMRRPEKPKAPKSDGKPGDNPDVKPDAKAA